MGGTVLGHNDVLSTPRAVSPVQIRTRDCRAHRERGEQFTAVDVNTAKSPRNQTLPHPPPLLFTRLWW